MKTKSSHPKHNTAYYDCVFTGRRLHNARFRHGPTRRGPDSKRLTNRGERRISRQQLVMQVRDGCLIITVS